MIIHNSTGNFFKTWEFYLVIQSKTLFVTKTLYFLDFSRLFLNPIFGLYNQFYPDLTLTQIRVLFFLPMTHQMTHQSSYGYRHMFWAFLVCVKSALTKTYVILVRKPFFVWFACSSTFFIFQIILEPILITSHLYHRIRQDYLFVMMVEVTTLINYFYRVRVIKTNDWKHKSKLWSTRKLCWPPIKLCRWSEYRVWFRGLPETPTWHYVTTK